MGGKKTPLEIKGEIMAQLNEGPKNIAEISEAIGSNWLTTEKFINELKKEGKVKEIVSLKSRVYASNEDPAFYHLPFPKDVRHKTLMLLSAVAEAWKKQTGQNPSRTIVQKIAVEFIEKSEKEEKVNIPVLRFHYGQTLALKSDNVGDNINNTVNASANGIKTRVGDFVLTPEKLELINRLVKKYVRVRYAPSRAEAEQYKKQGMKFYDVKNKVTRLFSDEFGPDKRKELENEITKMLAFYPVEFEEGFDLFDKFVYCAINLINLKDKKLRMGYIEKLKEAFYFLWDYVTTGLFFYDAESWMENKALFLQIKSAVLTSKQENVLNMIDDLEAEVNSINPEKIDVKISKETEEWLSELFS